MSRLLIALAILLPSVGQTQDWSLYDDLLAQYVTPAERQGVTHNRVNYQALAQDPRYSQMLALIEDFPVTQLQQRDAKLAFYINAYNILAIKMVIDHLPLQSIRDAGSWFSPVWKKPAGTIDGRSVTLDEIEHAILRPMGESRIHFAIVCASLSCPNLRPEAFKAERLELQLEEQTREFLNDNSKGLAVAGNRVRVSQIFDWFAEDFATAGGVEAFVRRYRELPADMSLRANLPYIWSLNGE
ncbi:MAG: DUF547 domain-containing protein [Gammaproteobacteria bacterium]|nr:DUF547 domain-containing protein [Gammaproteobacteria bacterium]